MVVVMYSIVRINIFCVLSLLLLFLSGCSGINTFPGIARAGDTVSVAAGWKQNFTRDKVTVNITSSSGSIYTYNPGDPSVRAIVNLYPDPVASLIVSPEIDQDLTPYARAYSGIVNNGVTNGDKDWWQTSVFIDLPTSLPTGTTVIDINSISGETASSSFEIIDGVGAPELFDVDINGSLNINQLKSMERVSNYVVSFSSSTIPYAIQAEFTHFPDMLNGGTGTTYVINPRGDLKGLNWSDDGSNLKVILTPAQMKNLSHMKDFKFYVAGGIEGLILSNVSAVDIDGNSVSAVTAEIISNN